MRVLVVGSNGQLGWELVRCLQPLGEVVAVDRNKVDLSDSGSIKSVIKDVLPDVIINAAAYTAVDQAEDDELQANLINGHAPGVLATEAKLIGALLIHYSTDYVFDGIKVQPYKEVDVPNPINAYGHSKLLGEKAIQDVGADGVILRTSWVYSGRGSNFLRTILRLAQEREELNIIADQIGAPTWARLVAESTVHVVRQSQLERLDGVFQSDVYHLASAGEVSWYEFSEAIVKWFQGLPNTSVKVRSINPISSSDYPALADRPKSSRMSSKKLEDHFQLKMPHWRESLALCFGELSSCRKAMGGEGFG